jgi:replicative DNA helicase
MAFFTEEGQQFEKDDRFALDFDDVKRSLSKVKRGTGGWFVARCPAHNDNNPSLAFIKSGNTVGFHCFSGCGYESIVRALGMWKDTPKKKERINSKIAATYDYRNEAGVLKYQVVRFEPKHFSQRRPDGEGKWIWDLDKVPRLLYKLPELLNPSQEPVFIVEGEKDVDNLTKINAIATTNSGGATKWEKSFNKYFEGRDVIIIADKDDIGYDHAEIVSKEIYRSAKTVKIVQLDVKDVSVYLEEGNTLDDLLYLCREIAPLAYTEEDLTVDPSQSHNLEAEMALLGAILANPILIGKAVEAKLVDHYFNKKTKAILTAMIECFEASQDINYITVGERFPRNDLERLGGYDFLKSLENNLPTVFDADSWINIIVAKSQYRELATIGKKLTTLAETEAHSVDSLANTVLQSVHNIKTTDKKSKLSRLGDSLEGVIISAREAVGKGLTGLSTGFTNLDYLTSGLQRTDLIILAGRPSMGKSAIAMNIAANAAIREKKDVAVFSLEMSKEQLISRVLCGEAFVDSFAFKNGELQEHDWARIADQLPILDEAGLYIDDSPNITVPEIRNKALKLQQELGKELDLIVIDYLQLMSGKGLARQEIVSGISREFKGLAKELNVPVLALSQLNREPEGRSDNRPKLSDLRESGSLEQDADVVAFAYRDEYYNPHNKELKGLAEVIVAKQRSGPAGTVHLAWLKEYTRFFNLIER